MKLDGAVEISIQLGLADAIADVVSSGRTLRQHGLEVIGEPIASSQAPLIEREKRPDRQEDSDTTGIKRVFAERLRGVVLAREYLMMDFDCPESLLPDVEKVAPGLQAPTVSPLRKPGWVAVRTMVPAKETNRVMDRLATIGATAILTSEIRSCRAMTVESPLDV